MGALNRADGNIRFIQMPHEEVVAFMACAHAEFSGEVGVCLATSGPGAIHLLNGLYDAKKDFQPVVAIVGQQARTALGSDYQQEVDLVSLYKDVAHQHVPMASSPAQVRMLIDQALRIAKAQRTVTCVIVPHDVQEQNMVESPSGWRVLEARAYQSADPINPQRLFWDSATSSKAGGLKDKEPLEVALTPGTVKLWESPRRAGGLPRLIIISIPRRSKQRLRSLSALAITSLSHPALYLPFVRCCILALIDLDARFA
jgi:hypothetical protein